MKSTIISLTIAGICAGAVNGLFGAGGGMILVPLLGILSDINPEEIFPSSVAIIFPICIVSLVFSDSLPWKEASPYLLGSVFGGIIAGFVGNHIHVKWLHRILGVLIMWGGLRYLCHTS